MRESDVRVSMYMRAEVQKREKRGKIERVERERERVQQCIEESATVY